jgi:epoxyqueuosine reductase QueG
MVSSLAVKERAIELGFDLAGIAPIGVWKDLEFSRRWVEKGFNGEMRYLENPKRFDPHLVLPSAKSVICVGLVYNTPRRSQKSLSRSQESEVRSQNKQETNQEPGDRLHNSAVGSASPVTGNNGQRTTDNARLAASSFHFPVSSFHFPVSIFEFPVSSFHFPVSAATAPRAWVSRYAWGQDYHAIMRAKLEQLRAALEELAPSVETRVFVDTGPVVERAFARFSGIGWMGKNTCIINQEKGSWFFLGVILTSLELAPDLPAPDRCGSCTACLEACPTEALVEPYVMDASRCISYFTIEIKGAIPERFRPKIGANVFGCDICQDVCPWNGGASRQLSVVSCQSQDFSHQPSAISYQQRLSSQRQSPDERWVKQAATTKVPQFHPITAAPIHPTLEDGGVLKQLTTDHGQRTTDTPSFSLFNPPLDVLALISEDDFRRIFAHSPIKRVKYRGWLRNLCVAMGNSGDERFVPWLEQAAQHSDPIVREHAAWALDRLRNK